MCTVSFIAAKDRFYITSNRDEKITRKKALPPAMYCPDGRTKLMYPKDIPAGGTWIAAKENGDAAVLLNGAVLPHQPLPPYRKSRGLVLLDILTDECPSVAFQYYDGAGIEPFTLILFTGGLLYECLWDGVKKHMSVLDVNKAYIWSSVTLYSTELIRKRKCWFDEWIGKNCEPALKEIVSFHKVGNNGGLSNGLLMRNKDVLTVSITAIGISSNEVSMYYWDVPGDKEYELTIDISPEEARRFI